MTDVIIILLFWIMVLAPSMIALKTNRREQAEAATPRVAIDIVRRDVAGPMKARTANVMGSVAMIDTDFIAPRPALPG